MHAQKLNNITLNAAASGILLTHVETQSAPTGGIIHLKPVRFLEHAIAQPKPRQREPPSSWTHEPHWSADQRQPPDTTVGLLELPCSDTRRHWLLKGKTYLTMAEETGAHVNHMVCKCWCKAPHKHNRVSNELHPLTQRHIMKTNDRQSSQTLTRGRRHNNHKRTCCKIRTDSSQIDVELGLRCAALIPRRHTTPHTSCASCPPANSMFHSHREGVVPHCPKERKHATRPQKTQNLPTHLKTHQTSRNLPPPHHAHVTRTRITMATDRTASVRTARRMFWSSF